MGAGKKGLSDVFKIVEKTDIPVRTFRPTHASNNLKDMMKLAKMGGYADFTTCVGPSQTAELMAPFLKEAPDGSVTMSSDSNGSMPIWNEKKEVIGIKAAESTTVFENGHCAAQGAGPPAGGGAQALYRQCGKGLEPLSEEGLPQAGQRRRYPRS